MTDAVRPVDGVVISYAAATDVVGVIDLLARRCAPLVLPGRVIQLRQALIECCTRAITSVDTSAEVVGRLDVLALDAGAVIDATAAAETLNMTADGVRWLCKHRRLAATKRNGRWWIEHASVELYKRSKG
jgi:hypothetical protein